MASGTWSVQYTFNLKVYRTGGSGRRDARAALDRLDGLVLHERVNKPNLASMFKRQRDASSSLPAGS